MGVVMGKNTDTFQTHCISWLPSNLKSPGDCSRLQTRCSKRLGKPELKALNYEAPHSQNRIHKYYRAYSVPGENKAPRNPVLNSQQNLAVRCKYRSYI